jgi:hypothetical protein
MKTGRLLKFQRPGGDVQAYLSQEGGLFHASVYVLGAGSAKGEPAQVLTGENEAAVERELRAWVEAHYPTRPA